MKTSTLIALAGFVGLPALALAQGMPGMDHGAMGAAPSAAAPPHQAALTAANDAMMTAMNPTFTGKPDRDFVLMMIPHHQGAIEMAKVELAHGTSPEIRGLAEAIIAAQEKEIADMQAWLAANP